MTPSRDPLELDPEAAAEEIEHGIRDALRSLNRRGVVVAVSGGVDSAVCASLAVRALGPERVFGLSLPERDSSGGSTARTRRLLERLGAAYVVEDITPSLETLGCYAARDAAVRSVVPWYGEGCRMKITIASLADAVRYFEVVAEAPDGTRAVERLPAAAYRQIVAATNLKQRVRKAREYFHAEVRNAAVLGTPNRLEYELGFFVRGGDGLADLKPIAHLYKTQVFALARWLGVPDEIVEQVPTTDTYSLEQSQQEFYFGLDLETLDRLLEATTRGATAEETAATTGLAVEQVAQVWADIESKRRVARRLLDPGLLVRDGEPQPTAG